MERATIYVRGRVQGVGFRWWVRARALELGLVGFARNMADGRVEVCAQGPRDVVERLEGLIREEPTSSRRPGHVQRSVTEWRESLDELEGFTQR